MKKMLLPLYAIILVCFFSTAATAQIGIKTRIAGIAIDSGYFVVENSIDTLTHFGNIGKICKDDNGNIYVVDLTLLRIRKIDAITHRVTTIAGTGVHASSGDGGPASLATTNWITGIQTDHAGNVYIADSNTIRKIDATTGIITTIAGGGSSITDGIPAASSRLGYINCLYVDNQNNIYCSIDSGIKKIDAITALITTVIRASVYSPSGDGGPAALAKAYYPRAVTKDLAGNLYFADRAGTVIRKINTSGIVSTISGNSLGFYYPQIIPTGEGGPAVSAKLRTYIADLFADSTGSLYFLDGPYGDYHYPIPVIRKIDGITGIINKVAGGLGTGTEPCLSSTSIYAGPFGSSPWPSGFLRDVSGNFIVNAGRRLFKIANAYSPINRIYTKDSTVPCVMPATTTYAVWGTLNSAPAPGDSVHFKLRFGDKDTLSYSAPYWSAIDSSTGHTIYGFGLSNALLNAHKYYYPGNYYPDVRIKTIGGYEDWVGLKPVYAGTCNPINEYIGLYNIKDSVLTPGCTDPISIKTTVKGFLAAINPINPRVYLRFEHGDLTTDTVVVKVDTNVTVWPGLCNFSDSVYLFTYTNIHSYRAYIAGDPTATFSYWPSVQAITSDGIYSSTNDISNSAGYSSPWPDYQYQTDSATANYNGLNFSSCDTIPHFGGIYVAGEAAACNNSIPYTGNIYISGQLYNYTGPLTNIPLHVYFGDGSDTTLFINAENNPTVYNDPHMPIFHAPVFQHTYTMPGNFTVSAVVDTFMSPGSLIRRFNLSLTNSCSPATGTFYIDANHNCIADPGEVRLAYWPFLLVNSTTGDTTNEWSNATGNYYISLPNTNSYTILGYHPSYLSGDSTSGSFAPSCPSSGAYTLTATPGVPFSGNFGFTGSSAEHPSADMSISAWGTGFAPSRVGSIVLWASDAWGYTSDSLSATVTLTLDPHLTYTGMNSGPVPSTIVGNVLTWTFSTHASLFDFYADVRVTCATTALGGQVLNNTAHVTPIGFTDPNPDNNNYTCPTVVRASFDPNEKDVSPKGFGAEGYIENETPLSYMIHFQNTGTISAEFVVLVDSISEHLDLGTLQVINSSSPVEVYHTKDNVVKFRFSNINLPDSASDPQGSIGYVAFNILPKSDLPAGTQIKNTAGIYFDYNPPVYTNSTINTIEDEVSDITGATAVCIGSQITLSNSLNGGLWGSTNDNATVVNGVVTGVHAGIDTISYTMYGDKRVTKVVTVLPAANAGTITGAASVCVGATTTLANTATTGTWSTASAAASIANGVVTGVSAGSAIISYTVANSCSTATATAQVTVLAKPTVGSISGADAVCPGEAIVLAETTTNGIWSSGNTQTGTISGLGLFTAVAPGQVQITYAATNACGTSVATKTLTVLAIEECGGAVATTFNVYPNPSTGAFTVEIPSPGTNAAVTLMDMTGRTIKTVYPQANQLTVNISMANLPSGSYMVKVNANGKVYTGKVVLW